jgi:hypothetical protein
MKNRKKRVSKKNDHFDLDDLIKKAEGYDDLYLKVMVHSVELYSERSYDIINEFLSRKNRGAFNLTNPHSKRLWLVEVLNEFLAERRRSLGSKWREALQSDAAFSLVTLTDEAWACADTNIRFDLKLAKQKVRNALAGTNFIANFDAALYKNETWVTSGVKGKLISFHCHAVVWGRNRTELDRLRTYIRPRFEPILGNENGARFDTLKTLEDVAGALAYLPKMTYLGYRTKVDAKGKKTQVSTPKLTYESRWHLFNELKKYSLFEFSLAGSEGVQILRAARNRLKAKYKQQASTRRPFGSGGRHTLISGRRHGSMRRLRSPWLYFYYVA